MAKEPIVFYDVKAKAFFTTDKYTIKTKNVKGKNRRYAVAKSSPFSDIKSAWKVLPSKKK